MRSSVAAAMGWRICLLNLTGERPYSLLKRGQWIRKVFIADGRITIVEICIIAEVKPGNNSSGYE